jgi:hypothetical protein
MLSSITVVPELGTASVWDDVAADRSPAFFAELLGGPAMAMREIERRGGRQETPAGVMVVLRERERERGWNKKKIDQ